MIISEIQRGKGQRASFDDALNNMELRKENNERNIINLAGAWKDMTDKEAKDFLDTTYSERMVKSRRI